MAGLSGLKKAVLVILLLIFISLCYAPCASKAQVLRMCKLDKIYQLGGSISDTGNLIREVPIGAATAFARPPYGETYFTNSTGRCSNGLLIVDCIALDAGLPFVPPYKETSADFTHGINFAVAGSTALPTDLLTANHIFPPVTNTSLSVQVDRMSDYFNSTCYEDRDCGEKLQNALFIVGQVGESDYNYAIFQGKAMEELRSMVPKVVDAIMIALRKAISFGANKLVMPGIFPIGCLPIYRTAFQTNISAAYDENHCLKELNDFAKYHNGV